jgi:3-hydroxybutyryl-CoA dehydrogenase
MLERMDQEPEQPGRDLDRHVMLVGAGLMGAQIGCEYALGGCAVTWVVRERASAERRIEQALALALAHRLATPEQLAGARARMRFAGEQEDAAEQPALIVESLPEQLSLKADVLGPLCARYPAALLASNTSSIAISTLADAVGTPERTLATHYWNPPLLMALVEVLAAAATPLRTREEVVDLLRSIGKRPVVLEHEVPGLLWNRLQLAVLRECQALVEQGVATPAVVDQVMRDGLARRWRLTGPFETVGLGGAATFDAIAANLFPLLSGAEESAGFARHVPCDPQVLDALRTRRDEALAAELRDERKAVG